MIAKRPMNNIHIVIILAIIRWIFFIYEKNYFLVFYDLSICLHKPNLNLKGINLNR